MASLVPDARRHSDHLILFALVAVCLFAFVVIRFPLFRQATGFGPDWDCKPMPKVTRSAQRS
jgi:hypothetical protein